MANVRDSDGEVHFSLKFGDGLVPVTLPRANLACFVEPQAISPLEDVESALNSAIDNPINSAPLREVIRPSDKVTIVTSDITRLSTRCDILVPFVLSKLYEYGVSDENITIIFGAGTHRPQKPEEKVRIAGQEAVLRHKVVDHNCFNPDDNVKIGTTSRGTPVAINRNVIEADKIILTGGIDFHALAGFSGGRKALCPGVASLDTIQANHKMALGSHPDAVTNPACGPGKLKGNPIAEDMDEIAAMVGPHFLLNTVVDPNARIVDLVAGHWRDAFLTGCEKVRSLYSVPIQGKADAVIASCGGFPKDINMWQSVRAIEAASRAVREGGSIILVAEARDGMGNPEFEKWFAYPTAADVKNKLMTDFHLPGYVAMRVLRLAAEHQIFFLTSLDDELARKMHIHKVQTIGEAIERVKMQQGADVEFAVMRYGKVSLPVLS